MTVHGTETVRSATDFLLNSRHRTGLWYDFLLKVGWSDEWISGYVSDRLGQSMNGAAHDAVHEAWPRLLNRASVRSERSAQPWRDWPPLAKGYWDLPRDCGVGWGYHALSPQDADTTSWVLRMSRLVGEFDHPLAQEALGSLEGFRVESGLMCTYHSQASVHQYLRFDSSRAIDGWASPHACVTAAAAGVPGVVEAQILEREQQNDGSWTSYWWVEDSYCTALAVEALGPGAHADRAAQWAMSELDRPQNNAFITANLLAILQDAGKHIPVQIVDSLARSQRPDGSWEPGAQMRIPRSDELRPDAVSEWDSQGRGENAIVLDTRAQFTTATVLRVLARA